MRNHLPKDPKLAIKPCYQNLILPIQFLQRRPLKCSQIYQEESLQCSICLIEMYDELIGELPCKHRYHLQCLNRWYQKDTRCPLCRTAMG